MLFINYFHLLCLILLGFGVFPFKHYIRLNQGNMYLMAIMDWYSRYVVSWSTSITLDVGFCLEALDRAIEKGNPEIFNTDQGSQFTSTAFTERLDGAGVRISMDGKGRVFDNIFH
jgi:putative transposase